QENVLAVVYRRSQPRMVDCAGSSPQRGGRFKQLDMVSLAYRGDCGTQAGPASTNDSDFHRDRRRTTHFPPPTQVRHASQNLRMGVSDMRWSNTCQPSRSISSSKVA